MFCVNCGRYNPDKEEKCKYCGGVLSNRVEYRTAHKGLENSSDSRQGVGFLLTLFFGVIAAIIGVLAYYNEPEKRSSFIKGALQGFLINFIISITIGIIYLGKLVKALSKIMAWL